MVFVISILFYKYFFCQQLWIRPDILLPVHVTLKKPPRWNTVVSKGFQLYKCNKRLYIHAVWTRTHWNTARNTDSKYLVWSYIIYLACHCDNYDVAAQCILCNDRHQLKYHVKIRIISLRFYYKLVHFTWSVDWPWMSWYKMITRWNCALTQ